MDLPILALTPKQIALRALEKMPDDIGADALREELEDILQFWVRVRSATPEDLVSNDEVKKRFEKWLK